MRHCQMPDPKNPRTATNIAGMSRVYQGTRQDEGSCLPRDATARGSTGEQPPDKGQTEVRLLPGRSKQIVAGVPEGLHVRRNSLGPRRFIPSLSLSRNALSCSGFM